MAGTSTEPAASGCAAGTGPLQRLLVDPAGAGAGRNRPPTAMTRSVHPLLRFRRPGLFLVVVLAVGTAGYVRIEHWDLLDSFFMTLITVTTVGYQEVHPLSPGGRIFTSGLIVGGVGTMLYAFGLFAQVLAEGQLGSWRRERQVAMRIDDLRDHFILCGYGRIGTRIALELERQGVPLVAIDNNQEALGRLRREERLHLEGDAASEEILRAAGIERARGLICAVDADERAVYITLAARALHPTLYIVARAGHPESVRRLELAGANRVLSPYRMAGHRMAEMALRPAVLEVMDTLQAGGAEIGVEEMQVPEAGPIVGRTLADAGLLAADAARVLAIRRRTGQLHVSPPPDLPLGAGDIVVVLGSAQEIDRSASVLA